MLTSDRLGLTLAAAPIALGTLGESDAALVQVTAVG